MADREGRAAPTAAALRRLRRFSVPTQCPRASFPSATHRRHPPVARARGAPREPGRARLAQFQVGVNQATEAGRTAIDGPGRESGGTGDDDGPHADHDHGWDHGDGLPGNSDHGGSGPGNSHHDDDHPGNAEGLWPASGRSGKRRGRRVPRATPSLPALQPAEGEVADVGRFLTATRPRTPGRARRRPRDEDRRPASRVHRGRLKSRARPRARREWCRGA